MGLSNIPEYSDHLVNTERVANGEKAMYHNEGGWPAGIDPTEPVETNRWRKKVEREVPFMTAVKDLTQNVEKCIE
jgi:dynein intermediate chain 2